VLPDEAVFPGFFTCLSDQMKENRMETTDEQKIETKKVILVMAVLGILCIVSLIVMFPTVKFNDTQIRLFSFERLQNNIIDLRSKKLLERSFEQDFYGRVYGNHVLETNLGEITLKNSANVLAGNGELYGINVRNFETRLAEHNLVFEGTVLPKNISVGFNWDRVNSIDFEESDTEIILSGIPLIVDRIILNIRTTAYEHSMAQYSDMYISVRQAPEIITLMDSTELHITAPLSIYRNDERWLLAHGTFLVKLPDESESIRYDSIMFGKDWGEFMGGETYEDAEEKRNEHQRMMTEYLRDFAVHGFRKNEYQRMMTEFLRRVSATETVTN
jgi:hypothetical protein